MNHGKGFPLPRYGNNTDSWVPVTGIAPENRKRSIGSYTAAMLGGPIPAMESESWTPVTGIPPENRKRSIGSYTSAMLGGPIPAMESEPWTPVTPEKPISQKPNEVGNENWGDLIGMYGHVLREETLDLNVAQDPYTPIPQSTVLQNRVVANRNLNTILNSNPIPKQNHESNRVSNPVSFFPVEDPANWSGSSLSALVRPNSASTSIPFINRPQNNGVHGLNLNTTPVSNSSTQVQRPNLGSILRNQQSLMESLKKSENPIVAQRPSMGGYNSNPLPTERFPVPYRPSYNLNSPPRSEVDSGVPFAPITPDTERTQVTNQWVPVKDRHEIQRIENENTDTHENEVLQNINESTSSAVSTTHKENVVFEEGGDELGIDLNKTPQQKTPARRKKHRPKVIREGKKPRKNVKSTTPDETRVKRKYVRKNIVDKVQESVTPDGVRVKRKYVRKTGINTETKANVNEATVSVVETPVKSCKKKLNFDLESVAADESQTGSQRGGDGSGGGGGGINLNVNPQDIEQERRINNILERTSMKVSQNINVNDPSTPIVITRDDALNVLARRLMVKGTREQMLRTGFIRMGQPVPGQTMINIDERRGVKRQICHQIHPSNLDAMKNLLTYQQFMTNQKRAKTENAPEPRRTNEGIYGNVPAMQLLNACQMNAAVKQNLQKHPEASGMQERLTEREPRRTVNAPEPYQRFMSERNQVGYSHRVNPVTTMVSWNRPPATPPKDYYKSGLVTYPGTLLDKRTIPPNTPNQSQSQRSNGADEMLLQLRKVAPEVPVKKPRGAPRKQKVAGAVAVLFSVEDITCRLEGLSIYDEGEKERNALVPYRGNNAIVPFEPIKKRKPRPKVDLDPETDRLWRLLMGKEGSEANETLDKDKEKWWEEERRVFRGRADSFIARMHLVQGDRRFSRWKGSVVDSVIGVFLTQNVSDHLSSSAFMSLAAKFSHQPTKTNERCCQKETRIIIEEPTETLSPVTNKHNRASDSVILSQDSLDSSMIQTVDELRSSSGSNSEAEDQTTGFESSKDPSFRSQTEKVNMFKELFSQENRTPQQYIHNLPKTPSIAFGLLGGESISSLPSSKSGISFQQNETPPGKYNFLGGEDRGSAVNKQNYVENLAAEANSKDPNGNSASHEPYNGAATKIMRERKGAIEEEKKKSSDWDKLRRDVFLTCEKKERSVDAKDSLDYEALRRAHVNQISDAIRERGMNNLLADRIKDFLDRLVRDHGSIDLEWLRDVPPDKAKEYLLSIRGLGLKSVECVRLLTLHHLAFPVDTNVGRIAVRLGWVPLQPLPESLQLHLLEMYPVLESIQKYLWPRLCKLDQLTLYELHYQMITFGKVFCTKSKPNCNACPMRAECRHFASAFASARLALPGPEEKRIVPSDGTNATQTVPPPPMMNGPGPGPRPMALPPADSRFNERGCEPIIEEPTTPEAETAELSLSDIEDQYYDDDDEIPTIKLDMNEFTMNLQKMQDSMDIQGDMSKALVALNPQAASIPTPKLKNVSRLRTEHQVYELPDSHPILEGLDRREPDDPSPYLLAIWTPGETANSMHPPERGCQAQESGILCDSTTCFSCNCIKEANSQVVRGTILMPCRTATRGSFPLNGTYFQVNEMFADHASSLKPIDVPRAWIWNLPRRTVYFGTSVSTIFKGLTTQEIQQCFWRGFVCVRGFDQKTRAPRPLMARLHFPASKLVNKKDEEK